MRCLLSGTDLTSAFHVTGAAQAGEETVTEMRHFMLAAEGQLHDLHSQLRLAHRAGKASQLHKCIVSAANGAPSDQSSPLQPVAYPWLVAIQQLRGRE